MKYYYVYFSYEKSGRGYIGQRQCVCRPEEDTAYFGSFKDPTFRPTEKIILFECASRREAVEIEIILHDLFQVDKNPYFANKSKQKSQGFSYDRTGDKSKPEHRQKISIAHMGKKLSPETIKRRQESRGEYTRGESHHRYGVPHTEENKEKIKQKRAEQTNVGGGCSHPWWVNEKGERTRSETCPGDEWQSGMVWDPRIHLNDGKNRRWVNEKGEKKRSKKHPGDGWQNGTVWKA